MRNAVFEMMNWWFEKVLTVSVSMQSLILRKHLKQVTCLSQKVKTYAPAFDVDMNQPGIQDWLQEMKDKSLSQYDIMTVGEANGVNP